MANFDFGKTWFHFRLLCAAHSLGIVGIAVTTGRPVEEVSLCKCKGCGEFMRTSAALSERQLLSSCDCFLFSDLLGS